MLKTLTKKMKLGRAIWILIFVVLLAIAIVFSVLAVNAKNNNQSDLLPHFRNLAFVGYFLALVALTGTCNCFLFTSVVSLPIQEQEVIFYYNPSSIQLYVDGKKVATAKHKKEATLQAPLGEGKTLYLSMPSFRDYKAEIKDGENTYPL